MAQTELHVSVEEPEEELSEVSLDDPPSASKAPVGTPPAAEDRSDGKEDSGPASNHVKAPEDRPPHYESNAMQLKEETAAPMTNDQQESKPESKSRRSSLTIPSPGISVSPAVAALPPISPAAQAVKQRQEAVDASNAPAAELPRTMSTGPAILPAFPAVTPAASHSSSPATIHPPTDADRFGYPAPGSVMMGGKQSPVVAIQEPIGEEDGVIKFSKPVAPGGGLLPEGKDEGDVQDPATLDGDSLSGKFDKVDLSDETGYQKGLAMLERGQTPTPDMMSPQEWVAFQQQRSSGLGKKHPTAQPGLGKEQQDGGWFQGVTPYAKEMGKTFGRLASSVENQITSAYRRGERRRDRVFALIESAQQTAAATAAVTPEIFEASWRALFNAPPEEELDIAYACSLNTEAGPLPGVVYQSNLSVAFSSDRPVAYPTVDGHSEQATYKLVVPWVEVTSIEGLRSQPLVQERYIKVAMANGDELWFLRFKDYTRGLTGMQSGLREFLAGSSEPSPSTQPEPSKPDSKPPSRAATPPLPTPRTTRSNSWNREKAPPREENLQETYTAKVHEAIEKARSSSTEHLPGVSRSGETVSQVGDAGPAESTSGRGKAQGPVADRGSKGGLESGVPVEKPGAGDILDAGQKEEVSLKGEPGEAKVEAPGAGDILDAGAREEVSLPEVGSNEQRTENGDAKAGSAIEGDQSAKQSEPVDNST